MKVVKELHKRIENYEPYIFDEFVDNSGVFFSDGSRVDYNNNASQIVIDTVSKEEHVIISGKNYRRVIKDNIIKLEET